MVKHKQTDQQLLSSFICPRGCPNVMRNLFCIALFYPAPSRTLRVQPTLECRTQRAAEPLVLRRFKTQFRPPPPDLLGKETGQPVPQWTLGPSAVVKHTAFKLQAKLKNLVVQKGVPSLHPKGHEISVVPLEELRQEHIANFADPLRLRIEIDVMHQSRRAHHRASVNTIHFDRHEGPRPAPIARQHSRQLPDKLRIAVTQQAAGQVSECPAIVGATHKTEQVREIQLPVTAQALIPTLSVKDNRDFHFTREPAEAIARILR